MKDQVPCPEYRGDTELGDHVTTTPLPRHYHITTTSLPRALYYYYYFIGGLKKSLVAAMTLQETKLQVSIQNGLQGTGIIIIIIIWTLKQSSPYDEA